MSLLESIIYGLISGITEFLPVSSSAHQVLTHYLFGVSARDPLQDLLVHIGLLISIFIACRDVLSRLRQQQKINTSQRRKQRSLDYKSYYELRLLKTASLPLVVGLFLTGATRHLESNLLILFCLLILNAVVLLVAEHTAQGNRDARTMTGLDGIIMGFVGALSVFPGISRTCTVSSYASIRGADSQNSANWAVLLGIPALIFAACFDFFCIFRLGIVGIRFQTVLFYLLSGIMSFCGGYISISFLKVILSRSGFSGFAYYSLGMAVFAFVLYLIT